MAFRAANITRYLLSILLMVLCWLPPCIAQPVNGQLAARLQDVLDREWEDQGLRGVSAAIVIPGEGTWLGVSGKAGEAPSDLMTDTTLFAIGSITKTFTGALTLQLVEEGRLSLEDSLHHWLPPLRYINPNITVRQLLGHKSGLYNFTDNPAFWDAFWADPARIWASEEVLAQFLMQPLFQPGSQFDYANTNYLLLGLIANAVTDSSMVTLMRTRLYKPHALHSTFFSPEEPAVGSISDNWTDLDQDGHFENVAAKSGNAYYSMSWAAGGMTATAEDMASWAQALFAGTVLSDAMQHEMLTFTPVNNGTAFTGYGLSVMRYELDGIEMWGHTGLKPGFLSMLAYVPESGVSICVLINQDNAASVYAIVPALYTVISNQVATELSPHESLGDESRLHQNYPNPVMGRTTITFELGQPGRVEIEVLDVTGRQIAVLTNRYYSAGDHQLEWYPGRRAGGLYFYRLKTESYTATRSLVYLRE